MTQEKKEELQVFIKKERMEYRNIFYSSICRILYGLCPS
jgi:hypothetical protein